MESLSPVHLAYFTAAVLLPARLLVIVRLAAEVPRLQARVRDEPLLDAPLRRSSNPYAEMARLLIAAAHGEELALEATLERALRKSRKRADRGQILDAASLLLLLGLLVGGRDSPLGHESLWSAGWIGGVLLATVIARAVLQRRIEAALRELGDRLRQTPRLRSSAGACPFCGSAADSTEIEFVQDGVPTTAVGSLCRNCGKIVATVFGSVPTRVV